MVEQSKNELLEPKLNELLVTTYEIVDPTKETKLSPLEVERLNQLDWSLCLLIKCTNFGFEELLKQLEQAKRLYCTETEYEIEKIMKDKYSASWRWHLEECKSDHSGASDQDNR